MAVQLSRAQWETKKLVLLAGSLVFYGAWKPSYLLLIALSAVIDWTAGKIIYSSSQPLTRKLLLLFSLVSNLGLLAFFKYFNFLAEAVVAVVGVVGIGWSFTPLDILLPVGISFYTFQTLSYTIDIYRGRLTPARSFADFALYVSFFPQLVAGPIVRAADFLPQCAEPRRPTFEQIASGAMLCLLGLWQKVALADGLLAPVVEAVYQGQDPVGFYEAWAGTLAFAGQIFFDFAGYSSIAIGAARCLGFDLAKNFNFPYAASGFSDFWRRWHMSLSTWLRDYLYIPLGGSRLGFTRTQISLMVTMLLGGLWHGASWNFIIWGGLHGGLLMLEKLVRSGIKRGPATLQRWAASPVALTLSQVLTFLTVCVTWVFFRAHTLSEASRILRGMFGLNGSWGEFAPVASLSQFNMMVAVLVTGGLVSVHTLLRSSSDELRLSHWAVWRRAALIGMMVVTTLLLSSEDRSFIYFQF